MSDISYCFIYSTPKSPHGAINVHHENGKRVGEIFQLEDGYYYFELDDIAAGVWPEWMLLELGNKLKELNKPWDDEIQRSISIGRQ